MKKIGQILMMAFVVTSLLSACQKKDDGGNSVATTPAPAPAAPVTAQCNVPGNTTCNPQVYQNNQWSVYPYQWNYYNGFCGCPANYRPVYNSVWGIGCAPMNAFTGNTPYLGWMYQAQNNQWLNVPQITYSATVSTNGNCFSDAAQACDAGVANSCGANAECRKIGPASSLGLCVSKAGAEYYGNNQCFYQGNYWVCPSNYYYSGNYPYGNGYYNGYYNGGYNGGFFLNGYFYLRIR